MPRLRRAAGRLHQPCTDARAEHALARRGVRLTVAGGGAGCRVQDAVLTLSGKDATLKATINNGGK